MDASAAERIADRYRVVRRLARGGMGLVLLAEDERLGREVAIKRMHAADADGDGLRRFEREARIGASLSHPNLVKIYDAITDGPDVIIVMEYVPGRSLADALREGPLEHEEAVRILRDVANGLDHAHANGVLHRDVKPANVLLSETGTAKLADLGIATALEGTQITRTGSVLGTPAYISPEQMRGEPASRASDIYALAAVAYEMLAGRRARPGRTPAEIVQRAAIEPPPDLTELDSDIPTAVADAVCVGMAADPGQRPESAGDLAEAVARGYASADPEPAPPEPSPAPRPRPARATTTTPATASGSRRSRAPLVALAALLAVLAAAAILATSLGGGGGDDRAAGTEPRGTTSASDPSPTPTATPAGSAAAGSGSAAPPAAAVRDFYERVAADDFAGAWRLASPTLRGNWNGEEATFAADAGLRSLQSIDFRTLEVTAQEGDQATVAISTRARHPGYTDACKGPVTTVRSGGRWLVDAFGFECKRQS